MNVGWWGYVWIGGMFVCERVGVTMSHAKATCWWYGGQQPPKR